MTPRCRSRAWASLSAGMVLAGGAAGVLPPAPARAQSIPVTVGSGASSLIGLPFDAPIVVDMTARGEKVGSFALAIRWDPTVLQFVVGRDGTFGPVVANEDSASTGMITLTGANPAGAGGLVTLGVGRFKPLKTDTTTFRIQLSELYAAATFADLLSVAQVVNRQYCPGRGRYGDVEPDGTVDSRDALVALMSAVGLDVSAYDIQLADVDADGDIDPRDALVMLSHAVGFDVTPFRVNSVAPGLVCAPSTNPLYTVRPGNVTAVVGQEVAYQVYSTDSTGNGVAITDVRWKTSDAAIAPVDSVGTVTGVAPGSATITAWRGEGVVGSVTVTVVAERHTHWVDALALEATNQLGSAALPFADIPTAVAYAAPGDTVRIRPGRYDRAILLDKPLILQGDTLSGARPLLARDTTGSAITVNGAGRYQLQGLRIDTLPKGVYVRWADSLVVRDVEFRTSAIGLGALYVDSVGVLQVQRSRFFGGAASAYDYALSVNDHAGLVSVDSTLLTDYGYSTVQLNGVDSLFMRGSTVRHGAGYGVYGSAPTPGMAAVFTGNHFLQNDNGHVYLDYMRSAWFDHNVMVGGGYAAIQLYGDTAVSVVSLRADSIVARQGGGWLDLSAFDSLLVDSVFVGQTDYGYPYAESGRKVVLRDSRFVDLVGYGLYIDAYLRDTTWVVLRNLDLRGPDVVSCDRCGTGLEGSYVVVDADSITASNLYEGLYLGDSRLDLRNSTFDGNYADVDVDCGVVRLTNQRSTKFEYGVLQNGCDPTDSLVVDRSSFTGSQSSYGSGYAVYVSSTPAVLVTHTTIDSVSQGINHTCGTLKADSLTVTGADYGIYGYGCGTADSLIVRRSSFDGLQGQGNYGYYGIQVWGMGSHEVSNSSFADWFYTIGLTNGNQLVSDNQLLRPAYQGISVDVSSDTETSSLLRNVVTCGPGGAAYAAAIQVYDAQATVAENQVNGCSTGISAYNGTSSPPVGTPIEIRGNTVSLPDTGTVGITSYGYGEAVRIVGNVVTGKGREGSIRVGYYSTPAQPKAEVDSNTVDGGIEAGIRSQYVDTLRIRDNVITNQSAAGCCVSAASGAIVLDYSTSSNAIAHVLRNRITDTRASGIVLERDGDTATVLVDSNTVKRADSVGIWVRYYSRAKMRWNAIDSANVDAVQLNQYTGVPPAVVNENNFSHSRGYGVNNTNGALTIDATNNWWGDATGPGGTFGVGGAGDSVSNYVTVSPFSTTPNAAPIPSAPPRLVASLPAVTAAVGASLAPMALPPPEDIRSSRTRTAGAPAPVAAATVLPHALSVVSGNAPPDLVAAQQALAQRVAARLAEHQRRRAELAARRAQRQQQREQAATARAAAGLSRPPARGREQRPQ